MMKTKKNRQALPEKVEATRSDLAKKISRLIGVAEDHATAIPGLMLHRRTAPTTAGAATYEPNLAIVVQGRKRVDLGSTTFIYDSARYLLTSVDLPVLGQVIEASEEEPYLCLVLKLEMPVVRELLAREDVEVAEIPVDGPAMTTGENTAELLGACGRLLDLLDQRKDLPFLRGLIEREIIYRILQGPEGPRLRSIALQGQQSHRTAKAISWIRANYDKPLKVEDLARLAGMGVSTLHHHFRTLTALSPIQYQKQVRLHIARNRMWMGGIDASSAAFEVGYESASQFNREYSRYFGQSPMRDVQSLRAIAPEKVGIGAVLPQSVTRRKSRRGVSDAKRADQS